MSNLIFKLIVMKKLLVFILLLTVFSACDQVSKNQDSKLSKQDLVTEQEPPPPKLPMPGNKKYNEQNPLVSDTSGLLQPISPGTNSARNDWDKKIIKTANLKIEVKDFKSF